MVCVVGLIVPGVVGSQGWITPLAAAVLACESVIFVGVHVRYKEVGAIVMCVVLGLMMAFVAYGRWKLSPIG